MSPMEWIVGIGIAVFLLFRFPKQALSLVAVLVIGAGAVGAYFWLSNLAEARRISKVITEARTDGAICTDAKYPVFVAFENKSGRTLRKVYFNLNGYMPGHSDAKVSNSYLSSDRILADGEIYGACWSFTQPYQSAVVPQALRWEATISSAYFQ